MDKAFSTETLAARWGCSDQHIRNMIKRGDLACFRIGNLIRIRACEIQRIEESSSTEAHGMSSGEKEPAQNVYPFGQKTGGRPSVIFKSS